MKLEELINFLNKNEMSKFKLIIILTMLLTSCRQVNNKDQLPQSLEFETPIDDNATTEVDLRNIQNLADFISKKSLMELKTFENNLFSKTRDTTFYAEDENISWPGILFFDNDHLIFWVESSWQKQEYPQRIVIVNSKIKKDSILCVGSTFSKIKDQLSRERLSDPDGYFSLIDSKNPKIRYYFDLKKYNGRNLDTLVFDSIPSDLSIETIVVDL